MSVSRKTGEVYYTGEELEAALKNNNALQYALSRGYRLVSVGNEYHLAEHDSMVFKHDGRWYWNSKGLHGRALDFIQAYEDRSYREAVCILAGTIDRPAPVGPPRDMPAPSQEEKPEFILPERSGSYKNLFAYLIRERGIEPELVKNLVQRHKIYQGIVYNKLRLIGYGKDGTARYDAKERFKEEFAQVPRVRESVNSGQKDAPFHTAGCLAPETVRQLLDSGRAHLYNNLIMVGCDTTGVPRYASMRSMNSKGKPVKVDIPGSDKSYPFVLEGKPGNSTVCIFESPIEAMSYWTLCKITGSSRISCPMISLGGAASRQALDRYLKGHPEIRRIVIGLNNDAKEFGHAIDAGRNGAEKIEELYGKSYAISRHCPHLDDWNDVLKNYRQNLEGRLSVREPAVSKPRHLGLAI